MYSILSCYISLNSTVGVPGCGVLKSKMFLSVSTYFSFSFAFGVGNKYNSIKSIEFSLLSLSEIEDDHCMTKKEKVYSTDEYDICCHCIDEKKCSRCACLFMVGSQYCKKHDSCDFKTDERGLRCQIKCINCSKEDKEKNSVLTTNQNNDRINITKNFKIEHNQHNIDMYSKVMENFYFDYLKAPDQELYIENNYEISGVPKNCFRMMLKTIESNDTDVSATTSMP